MKDKRQTDLEKAKKAEEEKRKEVFLLRFSLKIEFLFIVFAAGKQRCL